MSFLLPHINRCSNDTINKWSHRPSSSWWTNLHPFDLTSASLPKTNFHPNSKLKPIIIVPSDLLWDNNNTHSPKLLVIIHNLEKNSKHSQHNHNKSPKTTIKIQPELNVRLRYGGFLGPPLFPPISMSVFIAYSYSLSLLTTLFTSTTSENL